MTTEVRTGSTVQDRQRERAARGIRSRAGAIRMSSDRPAPPTRRRPALAALAVLLIVGGAALAGLLAIRLDSREPVLVANQDIPAGTELTEEMLTTTNVASEGLNLVPEDQAEKVLGTYTQLPIKKGQLVETSVLTTAQPFGSDLVMVGVPVMAGMAPSSLRAGDLVRLVRTGDGNTEPLAIATGLVLSTGADSSGGTLGGGETRRNHATILVPSEASDLAVDAASNERLGMALVKRGVSIEDAKIRPLGGAG